MAINIRFNIRGLLSIAGAFKIVELVTLFHFLTFIYSEM